MFDDVEYRLLRDRYSQCLQAIKKYRQDHGVSLKDTPQSELYHPFFEFYEQLAGEPSEFTVDEIVRRHYISRWKSYRAPA